MPSDPYTSPTPDQDMPNQPFTEVDPAGYPDEAPDTSPSPVEDPAGQPIDAG